MSEELLYNLDTSYTQRILKNMIRINSIVGHEGELAEYLKVELENLGLKCELHEVEPGRPNVYAKLGIKQRNKRLHFNGHTDTVPAVAWDTDPFNPIVTDEKLFGLGTCDMKAGIACILNMLRAFVESDYPLEGELSFSGVVDEEGYSKGAKTLLQTDYAKVDAIVLAEPYPGDETKPIPLGITGKILYDIHVKGKAAHGFSPHLGINAIEELGKILTHLEYLKFQNHPKFGTGNYSTIKIEGGYEIYAVVVPAIARAEINRLLVPGETVHTAITDMKELIESLNLTASVEVQTKPPTYQPFVLSKEELIIQVFDPIYNKIMGHPPQYGYTNGITDANIFVGEGNIPCLHLGPPSDMAHQKNEYVEISWLPKLSEMYTLVAASFLS
jgi:acetylornithine deacetylase/succinyl-diaminopimelate desuccinylase family protein